MASASASTRLCWLLLVFTVWTTPLLQVRGMIADYEGEFQITQILDPDGNDMVTPQVLAESSEDFLLRLTHKAAGSDDYYLYAKVGNRIGTFVRIVEGETLNEDDAFVGPVHSSRMLPPPDIYEIEVVLQKLLSARGIHFQLTVDNDSNNQTPTTMLRISGDEGTVTCRERDP